MKFVNTRFIKSASKKEEFIVDEKPQICFVGRSNVGKSSLINLICNNSKMAKTSSTPGRTRLVNYFEVDNLIYLVDLPGYGYHKAGKSLTTSWDKTMNDYFTENDKLKLVFVLLDARVGVTELDKQMLDYLGDREIPAQIILTKTDKISKSELNNIKNKIGREIRFNLDYILSTSAEKKIGREKIYEVIEKYVNS